MLCTVFCVPYNAQSKTAYRDFKDSKGLAVTGPMQRFIKSVKSLPVSTSAECERGFSRMNIICTELRSSLSISHMSSLMFIGLVGPALFKPLSYVKSWMAMAYGRRNVESTAGPCRKMKEEKSEKLSLPHCHIYTGWSSYWTTVYICDGVAKALLIITSTKLLHDDLSRVVNQKRKKCMMGEGIGEYRKWRNWYHNAFDE